MAEPNLTLAKITGIILEIAPTFDNCCEQNIFLSTPDGPVNFIISAQSYVVDEQQLVRGMKVSAFYDTSKPVPLIYPPRYHAEIIAVLEDGETVEVNYFNHRLTALDNSLRINISSQTHITTANGQRYNCTIVNRLIMVFYTFSTRSIPPQTTPERIIVLC